MRRLIISTFFVLLSLFTILIAILSTNGIKTNKFNQLITNKVLETKNIFLELDIIKFKLDLNKLSLFIETQNPRVSYRDVLLPIEKIRVYIDFLSLIKSDPIIKKININLEELDVIELNKLSKVIKPSNFRSLVNNKIKEGKLISEVEFYLEEKGVLKNFIAKGKVKDLKVELIKDLYLKKINFSFFADNNDILIKNIFGNLEEIKISEGDIKLNLEKGIKINSNFSSKISLDEKRIKKYSKFFKKFELIENVNSLIANLNNSLEIDFDDTYKVQNFSYNTSGKIDKSKIKLTKPFKNSIIPDEINDIYLSDLQIQSFISHNNIKLNGFGEYSFNNSDFLKINFENNIVNDLLNLKLNFDYKNKLKLDLINYTKAQNSIANINLDLEKKKNNIKINRLTFNEGKNIISIDNLNLRDNKFYSFKELKVKTTNNNFYIQNRKKIFIKGSQFDATNLSKILSKNNEEDQFKKLTGEIEIDFKNIKVPMSEKLENFKLIGKIHKGKFTKISSKGDFGGNNFLDISMKKNNNSKKKYLEIYSDLTRPLLTEYSFFNGLSGGKLLFTSIIDDKKNISKLKIENFKVINAPGLIKLLSLADLGGLADLTEGEGLSFDILEIQMEKEKNFLKIDEILALGPSISVLMEGYQDENGITSLKGTLVPAKTLNRIISKIPLVGDIVIPKEVGEGLFGISFKMKGPKGNIKTTINPIRTITPRFIQKIIDKDKKAR